MTASFSFATAATDSLVARTAVRDPAQVVLGKAVLGAFATMVLAILFNDPIPAPGAAIGLLAVGATGYGLSQRAQPSACP